MGRGDQTAGALMNPLADPAVLPARHQGEE